MFKTTKTKIIALVLVGVVALGGAVYATTALAANGAFASTASTATAQAAQTAAAGSQLRSAVLGMLKNRMGLTGPDAENLADQMIARMQNIDPNFDLQAMVNWCNQFTGANTNGWGMMGGNGSAYSGRGMMGAGTIPSAGSSNPSGASPQDSGSGSNPTGIMGGGMMGASGLR